MQRSQVLLILMGQFSFLTCQLYEYHFVKENKNWTEAQKYCKKLYRDLATVYDNTEGLIAATEHEEEAWIGLHNPLNGEEHWVWHWSLPGEEYDAKKSQWQTGEPNDVIQENCVVVIETKWNNLPCDRELPFICYNANNPKRFHLIDGPKNWTEAQKHCREHHTDLISGLSQLEEAKQQQVLTLPGETWIGLFSDTWTWAAGSSSSFRNWELKEPRYGVNAAELRQKKCATVLKTSGKWASADCTSEKPFVCYDDKVKLIEENKSWGEALDYCRENHYDLVSIISPGEQQYVQEKAQEAGTRYVWLGLRYTCTLGFWFWISDEVVEYENWNGTETDSCGLAGAMDREGKHQWFKKPDEMKFHFICTTC